MSGRFLRSKSLRFLLWRRSNGLCANCGEALPPNWHADHIKPWSRGGITNIFAMQALCPRCNLKKGNRTLQLNQHWRKSLRPGQDKAIAVIENRLISKESHTTIVLPTRYGKSDVIRLASILSDEYGYGGLNLALAPWENLRDQLIDKDKVASSAKRYGYSAKEFLARSYSWSGAHESPFTKGILLVSSTIGKALSARRACISLAKYCRDEKGKPLIVHLDECQLVSKSKPWGELIEDLTEAGAVIVLYTAFPEREDGERIPGFSYVPVDQREQVRWKKTGNKNEDGLNEVIKVTSKQVREKLEAHHETSFKQAWLETPSSPLCKIVRRTIDVQLKALGERSLGEAMLSGLSPNAARPMIGKAVRDTRVMIAFAGEILKELMALRQSMPTAAAMVFTGNDSVEDDESDAHANQFRAILETRARSMQIKISIVIATMKSVNGSGKKGAGTLITNFGKGAGDILIVKQMGGVGFDAERVKIAADLSSVRAPGSLIQRLMRIATPAEKSKVGTIITLADPLTEAFWQERIVSEGGGTDSPGGWITVKEVEGETEFHDSSGGSSQIYVVNGAENGSIDDHNGERLSSEDIELVDRTLAQWPELRTMLTPAEIAKRQRGDGFTWGSDGSGASANFHPEDLETINDKCERMALEIKIEIDRGAKTLGFDWTNTPDDREQFQKDVWNGAKLRLGIPLDQKLELGKIGDPARLGEIRSVVTEIVQELTTQ